MVSEHPSALNCLRAEYDEVITSNISETASLIVAQPQLLNKLPYTSAVIKETLRLFPAPSSTRAGEPGIFVQGEDGRQYPTEGCLVWSVHQAIHRDPSYWSEPDSFIPERWLVPPEHALYPVKGAWRPFEFGPRNCIGQKLATMLMKLTLIMVVRKFRIRSAYHEWNQLNPARGKKTVAGERAYQAWNGTPDAGLPCRVELAAK